MEVQRQLQVLADELNMVKNELVGMKSDHSALHNVAVETDRTMRTKLEQMETMVKQVQANAGTGMGSASKPLIEPKQNCRPRICRVHHRWAKQILRVGRTRPRPSWPV